VPRQRDGRAVECRRHPAIDRRLDRQWIGPGLLDAELDAQDIAQHAALRRLAQMKCGGLLFRHLRQRRGHRA
jgi:hypothetical protein